MTYEEIEKIATLAVKLGISRITVDGDKVDIENLAVAIPKQPKLTQEEEEEQDLYYSGAM